jgi:hypothetical protein
MTVEVLPCRALVQRMACVPTEWAARVYEAAGWAGATYGMRPNEMGGTGLRGRRMGGVHPAETGGVSPQRILRLDPQCGERPGLAVVACLFQRSCRCTSLPMFTPEIHPLAWPITS